MSQYPLPDSTFGSTNVPHGAPSGMASASTQATTVDGPYSERSRANDDARTGTGYPVHFSSGGESDAWPQDAQDDWIPGFGAMVSNRLSCPEKENTIERASALQDPQTRRDALNRYLQTPKFTYEGIVRAFWQQQQSQNMVDAQRKAAAEKEAMEREMRMRAEQQRQMARPDGQGPGSQQPRRF
ncbi:hypothetical protein EDB87DRAFT_374195 [Lactarius vividus]|nr:hypothetical protein EDB87DRAFT_374195 [Lactarius vividus]